MWIFPLKNWYQNRLHCKEQVNNFSWEMQPSIFSVWRHCWSGQMCTLIVFFIYNSLLFPFCLISNESYLLSKMIDKREARIAPVLYTHTTGHPLLKDENPNKQTNILFWHLLWVLLWLCRYPNFSLLGTINFWGMSKTTT